MKFIFTLLLLLATLSLQAQDQAAQTEQIIRKLMHEQTLAWNRGDLEGFMQSYWRSDSLMFIGKSGLTYGWQQTLDNYRKNYPNRKAMGTLTFELISLESVEEGKSWFVVGKWHLDRDEGDLEGHYSLLWKYLNDRWVIVADHSS